MMTWRARGAAGGEGCSREREEQQAGRLLICMYVCMYVCMYIYIGAT